MLIITIWYCVSSHAATPLNIKVQNPHAMAQLVTLLGRFKFQTKIRGKFESQFNLHPSLIMVFIQVRCLRVLFAVVDTGATYPENDPDPNLDDHCL
jgi:hypothetical protein